MSSAKMKGNITGWFIMSICVGAICAMIINIVFFPELSTLNVEKIEANPLEDFITDDCVSKYGEFACQVSE